MRYNHNFLNFIRENVADQNKSTLEEAMAILKAAYRNESFWTAGDFSKGDLVQVNSRHGSHFIGTVKKVNRTSLNVLDRTTKQMKRVAASYCKIVNPTV